MKKTLIAGLILSALMLSACGSSPASSTPVETPSSTASQEVSQEQNSQEASEPEIEEYVASPEILEAVAFDHVIQVGNTLIELPLTYDTLIEAGAVLDADLSPTYIMDAKSQKVGNFTIGTTEFTVMFENTTEGKASLEDCTITQLYGLLGSDVILPSGVTVGMSLSHLTEMWGEPTIDASQSHGDSLQYKYLNYPVKSDILFLGNDAVSASGEEYNINIDRNSGLITSIRYVWNTGSNSEFITKTTEFNLGGQDYILSYEMPTGAIGSLGSIVVSHNGRNVINIGEDSYCYFINTQTWIMGNKTLSQEALESEINGAYTTETYEISTLGSDVEGIATGYADVEGGVKAKIAYMKDDYSILFTDIVLVPVGGAEITPEAKAEFKTIVDHLALSIKVQPVV